MYASFEEYRLVYGGSLFCTEPQFAPYAKRASDYIDAVTFGRITDGRVLIGETERLIKKCCCALAENYRYYDAKTADSNENGTKSAETIGKYSVTYSNPPDSLESISGGTFEEYQYNTALRYLGRTGLMYRGVM